MKTGVVCQEQNAQNVGCPRHTFERQQGKKHKQVSRGRHWSIIHTKFKTENSLPRCSPSKRLRFEDYKEVLPCGDPGKIEGNAVAWDGPDERLSSETKRLQIRFKKELDFAERMRELREALP